MNKYKIYLRDRKNPIETIATEWVTDLTDYVFLLNGAEVFRINSNNLIGIRKKSIKEKLL